MKKLLAVIFALLFVFAGCSGSSADETPEKTSAEIESVEIVYNNTLNYKTSDATLTVTFSDGTVVTDVITGNMYDKPRLAEEYYIADLDADGVSELIVNVGVYGSTYGAADTVIYSTANSSLERILSANSIKKDAFKYGGGAWVEECEYEGQTYTGVKFTAGLNLGYSLLIYKDSEWKVIG